jgi:hypothetical protein
MDHLFFFLNDHDDLHKKKTTCQKKLKSSIPKQSNA